MKNNVNNAQTAQVKSFSNPKGIIHMKDIKLDIESKSFSLKYKVDKGRYKEVKGRIDLNLLWFISTKETDRIKIADANYPNGYRFVDAMTQKTKLERFMREVGVRVENEIDAIDKLSQLEFKCDNHSDKFMDNPFRLYHNNNTGYSVLCPVHIRPTKKVTQLDGSGQLVTKYIPKKVYTSRSGKQYNAYKQPSEYTRLMIEDVILAEVMS